MTESLTLRFKYQMVERRVIRRKPSTAPPITKKRGSFMTTLGGSSVDCWDPGWALMRSSSMTGTTSLLPALFQAYTSRDTGWVEWMPDSWNLGWLLDMFLNKVRVSDT